MSCAYQFSMDVMFCEPSIVRSKEKLQEFMIALAKIMNSTRENDCYFFNTDNGLLVWQPLNSGYISGLVPTDENHIFITILSEPSKSSNCSLDDLQACALSFFNVSPNDEGLTTRVLDHYIKRGI